MAKRKTGRRSSRPTRKSAARKSKARRASSKRTKPKSRSAPRAKRAKAKRSPTRARAAVAQKTTSRPIARQRQASARTPDRQAIATRSRKSSRVNRPSAPGLARPRRTLEEVLPTPPSSLDLNRHGSAVRTGRAEFAERLEHHKESGPELTGGDVDADWEEAYASGEEAPGGDNPTPDQSVVEDIGRSLGVEYDDVEELTGGAKVEKRDRDRWELDPASAEDYRNRK